MREIKFRAWDKRKKKMFYNVERTFLNNDLGKCFDLLLSDSSFELMEYTGITDTNCRRIYDGDIIAFTDSNNRFFRGEVRWDDDLAGFVIKGKNLDIRRFNGHYDISILGNIYENKELLDE